ncbi:hypothetical protein [Pseudomonas fluorescens]|uniref:hypothetical protein n=1 Tax=Pseudomonas fluorescens TaxID=294 RepID=UPI0012426FD0|nr:hypothetical protein [Pseudomonas fluorescens]
MSLKRLISNIRSAFTTTVYAFLIPSFHQLLGIFFACDLAFAALLYRVPPLHIGNVAQANLRFLNYY